MAAPKGLLLLTQRFWERAKPKIKIVNNRPYFIYLREGDFSKTAQTG